MRLLGWAGLGLAMLAMSQAAAAEPAIPAWLQPHVGEGEGQIAAPVLRRAHALYVRKISEGAISNPCYFAMDATRPNVGADGQVGRRFYIICDAQQSFRAISAGHGSGRNLGGSADFSNDRQCVRNFGNAMDSELTTGGAYVTAETKTSFKGYYQADHRLAVLTRSFVQFDGEGDTANARPRAIGGHAAVVLKGVCLRKDPQSPYANPEGYVPFGKLAEYPGGRSNGCTSWSPEDAAEVLSLVKQSPTTLYLYPDAADVHAVANAVSTGRSLSASGLYWNAACLKQIHAPKFWARETLEPIIAQYKRDHPAPPPRPAPLCREP
jgi:hypothetical protein